MPTQLFVSLDAWAERAAAAAFLAGELAILAAKGGELAAPAERYVLAYGAAEGDGRPFPRPRYDTSAIDTALAAGQLDRCSCPGSGGRGRPPDRRRIADGTPDPRSRCCHLRTRRGKSRRSLGL